MSQELMSRVGSAMHYDFCPWLNRYVYWLKRPIGWVVLAFAVSLLLGIYVSSQAYMAAGIVAAVGVVGAAWPWISMLGIRGELTWNPGRCEEEETIETTLTITNRWPWPAWGLVVQADDAISNQVDAPGQEISLSKVPGWTRSRFRWECRPTSRGIYPEHPVRLTTAFPFGIWSTSRILSVREPLIVWPRAIRLIDVPEVSGAQMLGICGESQRVGDDGDWMGVRPYREGDSLRQVHWAQTARRDTLVVFERQTRNRQTASMVLDVPSVSRCGREELDWLLRIVASLGNHLLHHSWNVRLHLGDRWHVLHAGNYASFMDQLAAWQPQHSHAASRAAQGASGLVLIIRSGRAGESTYPSGDRARVLETVASASTGLASVGDRRTVWPIPLDHAPEDQLREAWRRMCQIAGNTAVGNTGALAQP